MNDIKLNPTVKLKPCPFCGSDNLTTCPYYDRCVVHCNECQADGPEGDMPTCERLWNERASK